MKPFPTPTLSLAAVISSIPPTNIDGSTLRDWRVPSDAPVTELDHNEQNIEKVRFLECKNCTKDVTGNKISKWTVSAWSGV